MMKGMLAILLGAALLAPTAALGDAEPDSAAITVTGVCGVSPVLATSCLAVEIPLTAAEALAGFRWYNNDGTVAFPSVAVLSGEPGSCPVLADTSLTWHQVYGPSSDWAAVNLTTPVGTEQGALFVVFLLPANRPRTGVGAETGPGFGLSEAATGVTTLISLEGAVWTSASCHLAFEPLKVAYVEGMPRLGPVAGDQVAKRAGQAPPEPTGLRGVIPNPFNPNTRIGYHLAIGGPMTLAIYNLRGQRVSTLVDEIRPAGYGESEWRGRDDQGRNVPSGLYIARLKTPEGAFTQRLSLVR